jgi:hypothetical protein
VSSLKHFWFVLYVDLLYTTDFCQLLDFRTSLADDPANNFIGNNYSGMFNGTGISVFGKTVNNLFDNHHEHFENINEVASPYLDDSLKGGHDRTNEDNVPNSVRWSCTNLFYLHFTSSHACNHR